MATKKKKQPEQAMGLSVQRWHQMEGTQLAGEVQAIAEELWDRQSARRGRYLRNLQLFENAMLIAGDATGYYSCELWANNPDDPLSLIRSMVQTAHAEIYAKQKPKPQFQTSGAEWKIRRKAQKLDKICEGILNQRQSQWIDMWAFMADAGIETCVQGTSCISVMGNIEDERIEHELVPCCELYADPAEGRDPQNLFQVSSIDVDKAIALFCHQDDEDGNARRRRAIEGAGSFTPFGNDLTLRPRSIKAVKMVKAWRLPFSKSEPGKAVVVIGGEVMAEEEWTAPAFPFVFLHWERHRDGIWGSGICDDAYRLVRDAGDLDQRLLARARIAAGKRVYYQKETVDPLAFEQNGPETAIAVGRDATAMPVESLTPPFADSEVNFRSLRVQAAWDAVGISQISAAARREPGVESAVAMRTLNDTKSGRQLPKAQNFERAFVDLGHQYVWRLREIAKVLPNFKVRWPGKATLQEIAWADADIGENPFAITVAPASALPNDPFGRLSMAGELYAQRLISPQTYKQLLGWPDLEQELQSDQAEYEYIDDLIDTYRDAEEKSWKAGDYQSPDGMIVDKNRALLRFSAAYFQARREKAPPFNVDLLKRYIQELDGLLAQAQQAAAALGPNQGAAQAPVNQLAAPNAAQAA